MATYSVTVSVIGSAIIEVEAKSKDDAQSKVEEMELDEILESVNFDDSIEIIDVEKN